VDVIAVASEQPGVLGRRELLLPRAVRVGVTGTANGQDEGRRHDLE
jgi:hypothetical protein